MALINVIFLRSTPESVGLKPWGDLGTNTKSHENYKTSIRISQVSGLLKHRTFWLIGLSYFSISYSLYGITTFMVDYAQYQLGIPLGRASLLATIHGGAQILGVLTILPLSDYLGRKKTIIISNSFIAGCLIGIIFLGSSWIILSALIGIMAVFYGATFPMYGACGGDYFPKEVMGTIIGAWTPFYGAGAILVHWVNGILRDMTGVYDHAFIVNALMAVMSTVVISFVGKSKFELQSNEP
jgi:sugar phosphate permease